jgi:hypothetical protein
VAEPSPWTRSGLASGTLAWPQAGGSASGLPSRALSSAPLRVAPRMST